LRESIVDYFSQYRPDVFVGIDIPDFVLNIEGRLRRKGIKTVHLVAPQVWAWRQNRARRLARTCDRLLVLFPFEEEFFRRYDVEVEFIGHPLADRIPLEIDRNAARSALSLEGRGTCVALMPGSRWQEVRRHTDLFLAAATVLAKTCAGSEFLVSAVDREMADFIRGRASLLAADIPVRISVGASHEVFAASDAALVASGTVTMEGMLHKVPMVVAYRLSPVSYQILKRLVRVPYIAMPNILVGRRLIPEYVQGEATAERLAAGLREWLEDKRAVNEYRRISADLHRRLRRGAADNAARAIVALG
jgi:lipid-A-disaccharide synthase